MKWKRYLLILLIITTTYNFSWINIPIYYQVVANEKIEDSIEKSPEESENKIEEKKIKAIIKNSWEYWYKKNKSEKYLLKKEIQNRKKYHKTLLQKYNENFSKEDLSLIVENSIKIKSLKDKYLLLKPNSTI